MYIYIFLFGSSAICFLSDDFLKATQIAKKSLKLEGRKVAIVIILDVNSEHIAHACKKKNLFGEKNSDCDSSRSNQMP